MNYKNFLFLLIFMSTSFCNGQMFEFLKYLDEEDVKELSLTNQVNILYDNFEMKIKDLVNWELNQIHRVQKEIEFESKDLPENKVAEIRLRKFAELEMLITSKEIDLDFWYLEQLNYLNEIAFLKNKNTKFLPKTEIKGRIFKMVLENLLDDKKILKKYPEMLHLEYLKNIDPKTRAAISLAANTNIYTRALIFIVENMEFIEKLSIELIKKIMNNYSRYFSIGMVTNARQVHLAQLNDD